MTSSFSATRLIWSRKDSWSSFGFFGIRVSHLLVYQVLYLLGLRKELYLLYIFDNTKVCQFFGGLCMFSFRSYCIVYVATNYIYDSKLLHEFLQQVFYKLVNKIDQSFYPLCSFSIAVILDQNVLIETSCNNTSNFNNINTINNNSNSKNNNNINKNNSNSKSDKITISNNINKTINLNLLPWNVTTKFVMDLELLISKLSVLWFVDKKNKK